MNTFEGAYYTNLSYRPERNFFAFYSLACQDFPLDKIRRLEGVDGRNYETKEDAVDDLSEIYPEMEKCYIIANGWGLAMCVSLPCGKNR